MIESAEDEVLYFFNSYILFPEALRWKTQRLVRLRQSLTVSHKIYVISVQAF